MADADPILERLPEQLVSELSRGAVVAVSGGPDSTALLLLLLSRGVGAASIVAAHLDHRLRPESGEDAAFASRLARDSGVRFVQEAAPVAALAADAGLSLEAAARRARYEFLDRVAREEDLPFVVTGHHLEDQSETVLLRLIRGTGPTGLRGIHPRRPVLDGSPVVLLRPLLGLRRAEILRYLASRGISFREDPTNLDGSNLRSVLRVRLLPRLRAAVPDLDLRLAALVPGAERLVAHIAAEAAEGDLSEPDPRPSVLRARILADLPETGPPLDREAVDRVIAVLTAGAGAADLGQGYSLRVEQGRMRVRSPERPVPRAVTPVRLDCPGNADLPGGGRFTARPDDEAVPDPSPFREVVDRDRAAPPYVVRHARPGDRFRPLGLGAETTVYRFLLGRKVPREQRGRTPVVLSAGRIVWVAGHRIDQRAGIGDGTTRRAVLSLDTARGARGG